MILLYITPFDEQEVLVSGPSMKALAHASAKLYLSLH